MCGSTLLRRCGKLDLVMEARNEKTFGGLGVQRGVSVAGLFLSVHGRERGVLHSSNLHPFNDQGW